MRIMTQQLLLYLQIIMTEMTEVKYTVANISIHAAEPRKSTACSAGYDLFAAEEKTLFLHRVTPVTTEIKMKIPNGYFAKNLSQIKSFENYYMSCDAEVIDSDFRGTTLVLMTNYGEHPILIKAGQTIVQIVFYKKEELFLKS